MDNFGQSLINAFHQGGVWMVPIAVCFALTAAFSIERFYRLFAQFNVNASSFMFEIQKFIFANDIDGAIRHCNGAGKAAVPRVLKAGLQRASRNETQIQNAIDAASLEVIPKLERRLGYLALFANLATLLGLLGTVNGLIRSFGALAQADPAQRQAILAAGISEAMNATAFGLLTAISAMILHSVLSTKASQIAEDIDEFAVKLLDLLSARKYREGSGTAQE